MLEYGHSQLGRLCVHVFDLLPVAAVLRMDFSLCTAVRQQISELERRDELPEEGLLTDMC
jgi:hypothetical protein